MIIDWEKYTRLLLPVKLRTLLLVELIRTMLWQVPRAATAWNVWEKNAWYSANLNASTITLQYLIQREFGVLATIEELDGLPTDFIVNVEGTVDEIRLKALIDRYKLAGRSYTFRLGSVVYAASFINHQCEDIVEILNASFIDYQCEDDGVVTITGYLVKSITDDWEVQLFSSRATMTNITITGTINGIQDSETLLSGDFIGTILSGSTNATIPASVVETSNTTYYISEISVNLNPDSDDYFEYQYQNGVE